MKPMSSGQPTNKPISSNKPMFFFSSTPTRFPTVPLVHRQQHSQRPSTKPHRKYTQQYRTQPMPLLEWGQREWKQSSKIDNSRISFLDLALELREQIYEELLVLPEICKPTDAIVDSAKIKQRNPSVRRIAQAQAEKVIKPQLNILAVCRQTLAEASTIFFDRNTFSTRSELRGLLVPQDDPISVHYMNEQALKHAVCPSYFKHVTQLKFTVYCGHDVSIPFEQKKYTHPWSGYFGDLIKKTFPAMKKTTFLLDHPYCSWLRLFAIQHGAHDGVPSSVSSVSDLSDDTESLNDRMVLIQSGHWGSEFEDPEPEDLQTEDSGTQVADQASHSSSNSESIPDATLPTTNIGHALEVIQGLGSDLTGGFQNFQDSRAMAVKEIDEETRAKIHESVIDYWKKELGYEKRIPDWAEFEFIPRHVKTGNKPRRIEVDLQDIWIDLKKERDAAKKDENAG